MPRIYKINKKDKLKLCNNTTELEAYGEGLQIMDRTIQKCNMQRIYFSILSLSGSYGLWLRILISSAGKKKSAEGQDNNLLLFYDDFSVIIECSVE